MQIDANWVVFYIFSAPDSKQTSETVLQTLRAMYANAGSPSDIYIYHRKNRDGDYVYYVSPAAINLYRDVIARFISMKVAQPLSAANLTLLIPDEPAGSNGLIGSLQPT